MELSNLALETTGALTGITGVYLTTKLNKWCFPIGLVSVFISAFLFYRIGFFANVLLQLFFGTLLIIGWRKWSRAETTGQQNVSRLDVWSAWVYGGMGLLAGVIFWQLFKNVEGSTLPMADGFTTGYSFIAQWLVAKKKIENWLLWVLVNVIYVGMYAATGLFVYMLLYLVYLLLAVYGYAEWKKDLKTTSFIQ